MWSNSLISFDSLYPSTQAPGQAFKVVYFMPTGIVTTARVSHATPAALYAHTANRDWECEKEMDDAAFVTKDITWQLLNNDPGRKAKVVLGGGRSSFLPETQTDDQ